MIFQRRSQTIRIVPAIHFIRNRELYAAVARTRDRVSKSMQGDTTDCYRNAVRVEPPLMHCLSPESRLCGITLPASCRASREGGNLGGARCTRRFA